jgi:nucleotide-binding universal stress UspA family protein
MFNIRTIIVPTDFSRLSRSAFEYAKNLAETSEATVHLIHVLDKNPHFIQSKNPELSEEDLIKASEKEAEKQLLSLKEEITEDSEIRIINTLRKGIDYEEIVNYAKEVEASIIIIATHSRTGVLHNLLGSVAEKVIRYSKCPVLVIPPPED